MICKVKCIHILENSEKQMWIHKTSLNDNVKSYLYPHLFAIVASKKKNQIGIYAN
jgi:hypothetical protein